MDHTEMEEIRHAPTEFIQSSLNRINNNNNNQHHHHHHHNRRPGSLCPADDHPRPPSSIYSRATSFDEQQGINGSQETIQAARHDSRRNSEDDGDENSHEKDPNRLNGWVHPALRPNTVSISSLSAVLRAFPGSREMSPSDNQGMDQNHNNYHNSQIGQITAEPTVPVRTVNKNRKRRCNFIRLGFSVLAAVAVILVIIGVCIATGQLKKNGSSNDDSSSGEEGTSSITSSILPSSFSSSSSTSFSSPSSSSSLSSSSSSSEATSTTAVSSSSTSSSDISSSTSSITTTSSGSSKTTKDSKPTTTSGSENDATESLGDIIPDLEIEGPNGDGP